MFLVPHSCLYCLPTDKISYVYPARKIPKSLDITFCFVSNKIVFVGMRIELLLGTV